MRKLPLHVFIITGCSICTKYSGQIPRLTDITSFISISIYLALYYLEKCIYRFLLVKYVLLSKTSLLMEHCFCKRGIRQSTDYVNEMNMNFGILKMTYM